MDVYVHVCARTHACACAFVCFGSNKKLYRILHTILQLLSHLAKNSHSQLK